MMSGLRRGWPRSLSHTDVHTIWAGFWDAGTSVIIRRFHFSQVYRKHHSVLWPEPFSTEHSSLNLSVRRAHGKLRYSLQNQSRAATWLRLSLGRFLHCTLVRPRRFSNLYNVERLGGFVVVPSGCINIAASASSAYLTLGVARAFLYIIFF